MMKKLLYNFYKFIVRNNWLKALILIIGFLLIAQFESTTFLPFGYLVLAYFLLNPKLVNYGSFEVQGISYSFTVGDRIKVNNGWSKVHCIIIGTTEKLPHIFVDLHTNDAFLSVRRSFKDIKPLRLEADFGKNATVYAAEKDRLDVFTILNPATMQAIIDVGKDYDVEFYENSIILFSTKHILYDDQNKFAILTAAQEITSTLATTMRNWAHLKKEEFVPLVAYPDDRIFKVKGRSIMSTRRLISLLLSLFVTLSFWFAYVGATNNLKDGYTSQSVSSMLVWIYGAVWAIVVFSVLYIGFSRKSIDITF